MPTIANESVTSATPKSSGQAGRRTEAVGVEIPVVIHASRNSASTREMGKTLPVVHEETRTVIVFPQGAVVRLTAMVTTGELVVLTNQRSGADVLCRVASIKAQPGIQNYVDLEFTQRAPGFWGDCFPPERSSVAGTPASSALPAVPPAPSSSAVVPSILTKPAPVPPSAVLMPASQPISAAGTVTPVMPPPLAVVPPGPQSAPQVFRAPSASVPNLGLSLSSPATQEWTPGSEPQLDVAESPSGSKKVLLIAAAAVVLLGAIGGGYMLRGRSAGLTPQVASTVASVPASQPATSAVPSVPAQGSASAVALAAQPATATASVNAQPPAGRPAEPVVANSQPVIPPAPTASVLRQTPPHALAAVSKLSQPVAKKAVEASSAEPPPVLPVSADASQVGANLLNAGETATLAAPATMVPPSLTGGHIQQPKLISSPAPSYPSAASAQRLQGDVVVDALVDASGKVTATKVISGPPLLQQAAMSAVRGWRYEPARLDGEAISTHIQVRITFRLP